MKQLKLEVGFMGTIEQTVLVEDDVTLEDFLGDNILTSIAGNLTLVRIGSLTPVGFVLKQEALGDCEYNITVVA